MSHIVLLGDSVLDNQAYVGSESDVATHLRQISPDDEVTLIAVDGSIVSNVSVQLSNVPDGTTHLVVSVGGNDALMNADVLQMQVSNAAEFLGILSGRIATFEKSYLEMLSQAISLELPVAISTIYYPNFADRQLQRIAVAALSGFNDVIIRLAADHRIPILDLRLICSEPDDYANEIEPSGKGGRKIAIAIKQLITRHNFSDRMATIYF
jgi:GDSL-like Lipase/Acylhydrolase family